MSKAMKRVWNTIGSILVAIIVVLAMLLVGVRVVGLRPLVVLSGSMEPTYSTGSLIYVKEVSPEEIQEGDPITFHMNASETIATHRVVEVDLANGYFITKGDANGSADGAPVYFSSLIGKPIFSIPKMGFISYYLTTPPTMYVCWVLIALVLAFLILPDLLKFEDKSDNT